jgi:hypothetical protein
MSKEENVEERYVTVLRPQGDVWNHKAALNPRIKVVDQKGGVIEKKNGGRKRVAIVGFSTATRHLTPFDDFEYEIWGLNQLYRHLPRADRWFDIHENWDEHVIEGTDHAAWIKNSEIPVYMKDFLPDAPQSLRFPIEHTMRYFSQDILGKADFDYYTSTIAYMLALAIYEKFETIAIYGVDLVIGTEYFHQKACVEYYLGVAAGKGIQIIVPEESALLKQEYRYGWEKASKDIIVEEDFLKRREALQKLRNELQIKLAMANGSIQEYGVLEDGDTLSDRMKARKKCLIDMRDELQVKLALIDGAIQEACFWEQTYLIRKRGGQKNAAS